MTEPPANDRYGSPPNERRDVIGGHLDAIDMWVTDLRRRLPLTGEARAMVHATVDMVAAELADLSLLLDEQEG